AAIAMEIIDTEPGSEREEAVAAAMRFLEAGNAALSTRPLNCAFGAGGGARYARTRGRLTASVHRIAGGPDQLPEVGQVGVELGTEVDVAVGEPAGGLPGGEPDDERGGQALQAPHLRLGHPGLP